jgi:VWFA-related protein
MEDAGDLQQFRRKIVLMIDNNFIEKPQRDAALNQLDEFIEKNFGGNYEWSVITVGRRVQTVQTFTTDKQQIHAALDRVRDTGTVNFQAEQDRALLSDSTRRATMADAASNYGYQSSVRFRGREQTMRNLLATTNTARAVIQTCHAFAAAEGKKLVVLVTAGMERKTSFDAYDMGTRDRKLEETKLDVGRVLDEMVHEANAANFNLYVVKARGRGMIAPQHDVENKSSGLNLQSTNIFQQGGGAGPIDTSDVDSSSLTLALGTGGLYLTSSDTGRNFEKIDTDTSNYYSLGYSPHRPEDSEYHHISVKVKKPGLVVRHREGYVTVSFEERLEESLLSPLAFPKEKGSLPVTLDLGKPTDTDRVMVPMTAEMPLSRLTMLPRDDGYIGRVHVYLSIYDADGNNVGYHHLIRDVNVATADQARIKNGFFRYKMNVALKKGDFTFLVTLRDDVSNEIGTATQNARL